MSYPQRKQGEWMEGHQAFGSMDNQVEEAPPGVGNSQNPPMDLEMPSTSRAAQNQANPAVNNSRGNMDSMLMDFFSEHVSFMDVFDETPRNRVQQEQRVEDEFDWSAIGFDDNQNDLFQHHGQTLMQNSGDGMAEPPLQRMDTPEIPPVEKVCSASEEVPPVSLDTAFSDLPLLDAIPAANDPSLLSDLEKWLTTSDEPAEPANSKKSKPTASPNDLGTLPNEFGFETTINPMDITSNIDTNQVGISENHTRTFTAPAKPTKGRQRSAIPKKPRPAKRTIPAPSKPSISQLMREAAKREMEASRPPKKPKKTKPVAKKTSDTNPNQDPNPNPNSSPAPKARVKRKYTKKAKVPKNPMESNPMPSNAEASVEVTKPTETMDVTPTIPIIQSSIVPGTQNPAIRPIGKVIKPRAPRRKRAPKKAPTGESGKDAPAEGSADTTVPAKVKPKATPKAPRKPRAPRQPKAPPAKKKQPKAPPAKKKQTEAQATAPINPMPIKDPMNTMPLQAPGTMGPPIPMKINPMEPATPIQLRMPVAQKPGNYVNPTVKPQAKGKVLNLPTNPSVVKVKVAPRVQSKGKNIETLMAMFKPEIQDKSHPSANTNTDLNSRPIERPVSRSRSASPCLSKHSSRSISSSSSGSSTSSSSSRSSRSSRSSSSSSSSSSSGSSSGSSSSGSSSGSSSSSSSSSEAEAENSMKKKTTPEKSESPSPPGKPVTNPLTFEDHLKYLGSAQISTISPIPWRPFDDSEHKYLTSMPILSESSSSSSENEEGASDCEKKRHVIPKPIPKFQVGKEKSAECTLLDAPINSIAQIPIRKLFKEPKSITTDLKFAKGSVSINEPSIPSYNPEMFESNVKPCSKLSETGMKPDNPITIAPVKTSDPKVMDEPVKPTAPNQINEMNNLDQYFQEHLVQAPKEKPLEGDSTLPGIPTNQIAQTPFKVPKPVAPYVNIGKSKGQPKGLIDESHVNPCYPIMCKPVQKPYNPSICETDLNSCYPTISGTDMKPSDYYIEPESKSSGPEISVKICDYTKTEPVMTASNSKSSELDVKRCNQKRPKPVKQKSSKPMKKAKEPRVSKSIRKPKNVDPKFQDPVVQKDPTVKQSEARLNMELCEEPKSIEPNKKERSCEPVKSRARKSTGKLELKPCNQNTDVKPCELKSSELGMNPCSPKTVKKRRSSKPVKKQKTIGKLDRKPCNPIVSETEVNSFNNQIPEPDLKPCNRSVTDPDLKPYVSKMSLNNKKAEPDLKLSNIKIPASAKRSSVKSSMTKCTELDKKISEPDVKLCGPKLFEPDVKPSDRKSSEPARLNDRKTSEPPKRRLSKLIDEPIKPRVPKLTGFPIISEPDIKHRGFGISKPDVKLSTSKATELDMKPSTSKFAELDVKPSTSKLTELDMKPSTSKAAELNMKPSTYKFTELEMKPSTSKAAELNMKPSTSKLTEMNMKPSTSKLTELNIKPSTSKLTELDMKPSTSKAAELNMKPSTSKLTELDMKPSTSKAAELNMKTSTSKEAELNMKPRTSKLTELDLKPSTSKAAELNMKTSTSKAAEINTKASTSKVFESAVQPTNQNISEPERKLSNPKSSGPNVSSRDLKVEDTQPPSNLLDKPEKSRTQNLVNKTRKQRTLLPYKIPKVESKVSEQGHSRPAETIEAQNRIKSSDCVQANPVRTNLGAPTALPTKRAPYLQTPHPMQNISSHQMNHPFQRVHPTQSAQSYYAHQPMRSSQAYQEEQWAQYDLYDQWRDRDHWDQWEHRVHPMQHVQPYPTSQPMRSSYAYQGDHVMRRYPASSYYPYYNPYRVVHPPRSSLSYHRNYPSPQPIHPNRSFQCAQTSYPVVPTHQPYPIMGINSRYRMVNNNTKVEPKTPSNSGPPAQPPGTDPNIDRVVRRAFEGRKYRSLRDLRERTKLSKESLRRVLKTIGKIKRPKWRISQFYLEAYAAERSGTSPSPPDSEQLSLNMDYRKVIDSYEGHKFQRMETLVEKTGLSKDKLRRVMKVIGRKRSTKWRLHTYKKPLIHLHRGHKTFVQAE